MSADHHSRELWRRFLAEPTHENAYLWARTEARMRNELPDPPVADRPLRELAPAFRCLAGGVAGRLERLLLGLLAEAQGGSMLVTRPGVLTLRALGDADPDAMSMLEGAGSFTLFAAFFALRAFGLYRLPWEAWHLKAARVYPGALRQISGRASDMRFKLAVRDLAASCVPA